MEGGRLKGGRLIEVLLYSFFSDGSKFCVHVYTTFKGSLNTWKITFFWHQNRSETSFSASFLPKDTLNTRC